MFSGVKKDPKFVEKQRQSILKTLNSEGYVHPNTGKKASEETLQRMSLATKNRPKKTCPNCNRLLDPANYARYHGEKCKQKNN